MTPASPAKGRKGAGEKRRNSTVLPALPPLSTFPHSTRFPVPASWRREVARVLITERQIARRIRKMSRQIEHDFRGRELVVVSLLNGTVMFLADLIRYLSPPLRLDFMRVSSYVSCTTSVHRTFTKALPRTAR